MFNIETVKRGLLVQIAEQFWCKMEYDSSLNRYTFDNGIRWYADGTDNALAGWLDTLIDQDEERAAENLPPLWAVEIAFINEILRNN